MKKILSAARNDTTGSSTIQLYTNYKLAPRIELIKGDNVRFSRFLITLRRGTAEILKNKQS